MQGHVDGSWHRLQVGKLIVLAVFVLVMDIPPLRDGTMRILPHCHMQTTAILLEIPVAQVIPDAFELLNCLADYRNDHRLFSDEMRYERFHLERTL